MQTLARQQMFLEVIRDYLDEKDETRKVNDFKVDQTLHVGVCHTHT